MRKNHRMVLQVHGRQNIYFPLECSKEVLLELLNSMHPSIRYTVDEPDTKSYGERIVQILIFLSILLHLDDEGNIWTNVHYKETNAFDYLSWDSHHPQHIKENIPYCLAKRILVITTKPKDIEENLKHLRQALSSRGYPNKIIEKGIFNAKLQGPAPPKSKDTLIPLSSMYYSNYSNSTVVTVSKQLLENTKDERLIRAFKDVSIIEAFKQPPNLLRILSNSAFISTAEKLERKPGVSENAIILFVRFATLLKKETHLSLQMVQNGLSNVKQIATAKM